MQLSASQTVVKCVWSSSIISMEKTECLRCLEYPKMGWRYACINPMARQVCHCPYNLHLLLLGVNHWVHTCSPIYPQNIGKSTSMPLTLSILCAKRHQRFVESVKLLNFFIYIYKFFWSIQWIPSVAIISQFCWIEVMFSVLCCWWRGQSKQTPLYCKPYRKGLS